MSVSKSESKSSLTKKKLQLGDAEEKRQLKNLQPDGRKIPGTGKEYNENPGDMSHEAARNSTFEHFPKKVLIDRIIGSGFFYTGKGDATQCHKCNAVVKDWNDKDNPAAFHEPDCKFFTVAQKSNAVKNKNGFVDEHMSQEDRVLSILDAPITEANNDTLLPLPLLKPTIVRSQSHRMPYSSNAHELLTTEATRSHDSLPIFVERKQVSVKSKIEKEYITKVRPKPYLQASGMKDKDFEELLKNLNLYSEEDRRKTFLYKRSWSENTNNVIPPNVLAADGFYYLGDLDRTRCFSCDKVFRFWLRSDNVNKVHRKTVVYCKMAQGKDRQNIAIPAFQALDDYSSTTSSSSFDITLPSASKLSGELAMSSNHDTFLPPVQHAAEDYHNRFLSSASSLQISKSSTSEQSGNVSEHEILSGTQAQELQREFSQKPVSHGANDLPQSSTVQPLDLTTNKNILSQALHKINGSSQQDVLITPQDNRSMELEGQLSVPLSIEEHFVPKEELHFLLQPSFEENILPEENHHSVGSNIGASIMESSYSEVRPGHRDQATLDNNPTSLLESMELSPGSEPLVSPLEVPPMEVPRNGMQVSEPENPYFDTFPCNEPVYPQMRFLEQRRETYMNCPTLGSINKEEFIAAGFYYNIQENQLECWYCGGGITRWNTITDPWDFHAYRFPNCEFVLQQKGPDFVGEASRRGRPMTPVSIEPRMSFPRFRRMSDSNSSNSSMESPPSSPLSAGGARRILFNWVGGRSGFGRSHSPPKVVDPREEKAKHKKILESALNSEVTISAMNMGFEIQAIRKAYKHKIETTGENFPTTDALLDALLTQSPAGSESSDDSEEEEAGPSSSSVDPVPSAGGASAAQGGTALVLGEKEQESKMREYEQEKRCKVCLDRDAVVVFMPCGHLCTCIECANALRTCPLCRKRIQKSMKIYTA